MDIEYIFEEHDASYLCLKKSGILDSEECSIPIYCMASESQRTSHAAADFVITIELRRTGGIPRQFINHFLLL